METSGSQAPAARRAGRADLSRTRLRTVSEPAFGLNDRPADVLDGAGRWLATSLPGFRWVKSRQDVERKTPPQVHRVALQSSSWSRAGVGTFVSPRLIVLDDRLLRWRKRNRELSPVRDPETSFPMVFNSLFVNFLQPWSSFEASGLPQPSDGPRAVNLAEFLRCITAHVLPVLDDFAHPGTVVSGLPTTWWGMVDAGTVEWSLACGDRDSAAAIIHRHLERPLKGLQSAESRLSPFSDGWAAGHRREAPPPDLPLSVRSLGWLSAVHALVDPEAIGTPVHRSTDPFDP